MLEEESYRIRDGRRKEREATAVCVLKKERMDRNIGEENHYISCFPRLHE